MSKQYLIIKIITDTDLVTFQKKCDLFIADKKVITYITNVTVIPMGMNQNSNAMGMIAVPSCYIEYEVTEQQHKEWCFNQTIMRS